MVKKAAKKSPAKKAPKKTTTSKAKVDKTVGHELKSAAKASALRRLSKG
jgi:hypothetical protein